MLVWGTLFHQRFSANIKEDAEDIWCQGLVLSTHILSVQRLFSSICLLWDILFKASLVSVIGVPAHIISFNSVFGVLVI